MMKNYKIPSWILQPTSQIIIFIASYSIVWAILKELGYVHRDVSWGILIELLIKIFGTLSIALGILKYFRVLSSKKLSYIFLIVFLICSGYFLSYSIVRLCLIWILAISSTLIAHLISNQR